jgi:signal transduction histidine kinase
VVVRRERRRQLEGLGRLTAQMAHDLKNPLAALKGAVDYLVEELAQGRSIDPQREFLELMAQQVTRISGVIEQYQRLSSLEPMRVAADLNAVVRQVLALQAFTGHDRVALETDLAESLPPCRFDPELLATALENLVKNAFEAMPQGGTLRVRTCGENLGTPWSSVVLAVEDTGQGMDARQRERAFDSFYTTKPQGSGLGLSQVRRVVEAHEGSLSLVSQVGRGTVVTVRLPAEAPLSPAAGSRPGSEPP